MSLPQPSEFLPAFVSGPIWLEMLTGIGILIALAALTNFIVKQVVLRLALRALPPDSRYLKAIVARIANVAPALVVSGGIVLVPHLPPWVVDVTRNVVAAFIILTVALAMGKVLDLGNEIYSQRPEAANKPIKGYVQVGKILLYGGAVILMIAALFEQSPFLLLSGLGAMAAVLLLVFKDTILSLVASVQLTSNDMLRVGDWIEMPQLNADGDVIDIALHTVKVQNFDKTITTIPTHRLIEESYKNWRGMRDAGGRRIKRSLWIDQNSVRFLSPDELEALGAVGLLRNYLNDKAREIERWNAENADERPINQRRPTNIGTFRAYVIDYLRAHSRITADMTLLVRQLEPTPQGVPLEIYCFTDTTNWKEYEAIQSDIFDHLIAVTREFGLRLFQRPSGLDFRREDGFASVLPSDREEDSPRSPPAAR